MSDRGDRLLLLTHHGLHAATRCVLPWANPTLGTQLRHTRHSSPAGAAASSPAAAAAALPPPPEAPSSVGSSSSGGGGDGGGGGGGGDDADIDVTDLAESPASPPRLSAGGGACFVTAIAECPDVSRSDTCALHSYTHTHTHTRAFSAPLLTEATPGGSRPRSPPSSRPAPPARAPARPPAYHGYTHHGSHCTGVCHLAVANSRGAVVFLKI